MAPNPRNLILNLLLGAGSEPLSARSAVASCALFGIRENSVRVALVRLAASGLVEAAGRGAYRLGPNAAQLAADLATWRGAEARLSGWNGGWIAVHAGPLGRSDRAALRMRDRALGLLGMRELDRGLHLRPDNLAGGVAAARERLFKLGLEPATAVFVARGLDDARELRARALWDGAALDRGYREARRRLEDWLARADALEPEVAARESFLLGNDAIRQLVFDPLLPSPLVDADARHRFIDAVVRFDAAGQSIWKRFREEPTP
ncbi:PaaX family transcriptional regulator C-terminal domain-containing protein [Quisquiliibacterium transsilvanicum]|uniref:Phenylacetic acid degradation operon negative regulatory protein n=1 Tax=Quisquiliibacterium transsilvanicum TaxID=1549638 RepID=A0A7W8HKI0_9BURK|nr:PaaX family transcriptional regulator C-terminal domain-containing protein [Quisquiliibacterium transsilvanicum]MBB5272805.1 phenylacetic acid degradation operon negative regulatory protein [Quisquiliibacterium transsilvanicum]